MGAYVGGTYKCSVLTFLDAAPPMVYLVVTLVYVFRVMCWWCWR